MDTKLLKKNVRRSSLSLIAIVAFLSLSSFSVVPANVDFSGQWTLNESKSELGQYGGRMAARKMKVTADANGLSMERTINGPNGEVASTDKLTFDGKETESAFFGENKKKSTVKWSEDGKVMLVNSVAAFDRNGEKMEFKIAETWKLSDDGAILTIETATASSFGNNSTRFVYDKVK